MEKELIASILLETDLFVILIHFHLMQTLLNLTRNRNRTG